MKKKKIRTEKNITSEMMDHEENFPKLGHVNEICKEWLVREDGAFAYKLQSHEINEFYKGNKYRNAVVREDFPKALTEQIKEKELAANLSAAYREREQQDKQYAEELARNIEKIRSEQRVKEAEVGEMLARQLQDVYINPEVQQQQQQKENKYPMASNFPPLPSATASNNTIGNNSHQYRSDINNSQIRNYKDHANDDEDDDGGDGENIDLACNFLPVSPLNRRFQRYSPNETRKYLDLLDDGDDNIQSYENIDIRGNVKHYNPNPRTAHYEEDKIHPSNYLYENTANKNYHRSESFPEKYNYLMETTQPKQHSQRINTSTKSNRQVKSEADCVNLEELGLSLDEIQQIEQKISQEKRDEELARKLQEQEQKESLTLEERDRLLAMEVQDKELARMLQDREKAKARKAKEKARLKRNQQQKMLQNPNEDFMMENDNSLPIEQDSYSNPIDLIPEGKFHSKKVFGRDGTDRQYFATDEDIYTLPIDTSAVTTPVAATAAAGAVAVTYAHHDKSKSLDITDTISHIPRSDTIHGLPSLSSNSLPKSNSLVIDNDSSPVPPYVPIKSTRRPSDSDGKKKKNKDKCIHQ